MSESFHAPDLALGVKVTVRDVPGTVTGILHYTLDQDSHWSSYQVASGRDTGWLTVVDEPTGPETVAWRAIELAAGTPGDATLEHDGMVYLHQDGGTARYRSEGAVDLPREGISEWHDYLVGRWRLSVERFDGGPWEASVGEVVPIGDLVVGR